MHNEIAELIKISVKNTQSFVFGSYLGTQVKSHFPAVDLKMFCGGLRRFISQYCADEVIWVEKKGGDDVYVHGSKLDSVSRLPKIAAMLRPPVVENLWRVFTSPGNPRGLIVNISTGEITAHSSNDEPPGWKSVAKLNVDDHRTIAQEFLSSVELLDRAELEKILGLQEFWQPWLQAMRFGFSGRYATPWWNFRNSRILHLFAERLRGLDISSPTVEIATKYLMQARTGGSHTPRFGMDNGRSMIPAPVSPLPARVNANIPTAEPSDIRAANLRQLIHAAIEKLDEEQLRAIRLPVGAIADGLTTRKW